MGHPRVGVGIIGAGFAARFHAAGAHDRPALSEGELGREVVRVVYAAYRSAQEGRRVLLA